MGVLGVIALMVVKLKFKDSILGGNSVLIWNTVIASSCIAMLLFCFGCYLRRVYLVNSKKMRWYLSAAIDTLKLSCRLSGLKEGGKDPCLVGQRWLHRLGIEMSLKRVDCSRRS